MKKHSFKTAIVALMLAIATPAFAQFKINGAKAAKALGKTAQALTITDEQIGRASCRERVFYSV